MLGYETGLTHIFGIFGIAKLFNCDFIICTPVKIITDSYTAAHQCKYQLLELHSPLTLLIWTMGWDGLLFLIFLFDEFYFYLFIF